MGVGWEGMELEGMLCVCVCVRARARTCAYNCTEEEQEGEEKEEEEEREREKFMDNQIDDWRSVSTTPLSGDTASGHSWAMRWAQRMAASTIPPLSVWPCGTPFGKEGNQILNKQFIFSCVCVCVAGLKNRPLF